MDSVEIKPPNSNLNRPEVLALIVVENSSAVGIHFDTIRRHYLIPIIEQLKAPILIQSPNGNSKVKPVLQLGLILYQDYHSHLSQVVTSFGPTVDMTQFIKTLNDVKLQGKGFYSTPVAEGLMGAVEFYDHYITPNQLSSFNVILVSSSVPSTQNVSFNYHHDYDNISLNDVCGHLKQRSCQLSVIGCKPGLNSLFNLMNSVNGSNSTTEDCSKLFNTNFMVKLAGIKVPSSIQNEKNGPSKIPSVKANSSAETKSAETPSNQEAKTEEPASVAAPKTPLKSGDLLGSFLDTQALESKPNKDDLMDFLESQDLLQNPMATTNTDNATTILSEPLAKPIIKSPQEIENKSQEIANNPVSTTDSTVPAAATSINIPTVTAAPQIKEEPKPQTISTTAVNTTSEPALTPVMVPNASVPISTPQVIPVSLPAPVPSQPQPAKPIATNPQVGIVWNGAVSWPNEHNQAVPNSCPIAAIPLPGAQGPVPIERYQLKMWPAAWTISRLMPLMLEWWKGQVQMFGIPCVNLIPSPGAARAEVLIKYQAFLKFLELRSSVGVVQFFDSGVSYGIVMLSHSNQLTGLVFLNHPIPTLQPNQMNQMNQMNPMVQTQPMITPEAIQIRNNLLSQLNPQQQLQLQQNPQLMQQFMMQYLSRMNQNNAMNINANQFNTSNPNDVNMTMNMNPMGMNLANLNNMNPNNTNPNQK